MKNSRTGRSSRSQQESRRRPGGRMSDENGRFSSDDGGYYSNRNFGSRNEREQYGSDRDSGYDSGRGSYGREYDEMDSSRRSQGSRYAPYRSSEQDYEANSRWDNDGYGKSKWNRPEGDRSDRNTSDRERSAPQRDNQRSSRWGKEDFGWGGRMSGRDQETGYNTDMTDEDNYGDMEGISEGRSARFSDIDDVEGQYDEDYRDRDSYSHSRRSRPSSKSNYGSRR